jgi:hypothetical protein
MLETLELSRKNIDAKAKAGKVLRDQELRFINHYPETRKKYELLIADSLEEDVGLPEGKLKEFVDRLEWMESIGNLEEVIKETDYYRCDKCGELHAKSRKCMYTEFKEMQIDEDEEEA